jgi:hypothetical protein
MSYTQSSNSINSMVYASEFENDMETDAATFWYDAAQLSEFKKNRNLAKPRIPHIILLQKSRRERFKIIEDVPEGQKANLSSIHL